MSLVKVLTWLVPVADHAPPLTPFVEKPLMVRTGFAATSVAEKLMVGDALVTPVKLRALAAAKASRT